MDAQTDAHWAENEQEGDSQMHSAPDRGRQDSQGGLRNSDVSEGSLDKKSGVIPDDALLLFHPKFQSVEVHFPSKQPDTLFSHMVYRIEVLWDGQSREVARRYASVAALKSAIEARLPFHLVYPVHYKHYIQKTDATFLSQRTNELNYFFRYLIFHSQKFQAIQPVLETFFSTSYDDAVLLKRLADFKEPPEASQLLPVYRRLTVGCDFSVPRLEKRKELDRFHASLTTTIKFFKVS